MNPICSEMRAPNNTRDRMSRPKWSVPIQCSMLGGAMRSRKFPLSGSNGAMTPARHASTTTAPTSVAPMTKDLFASNRRRENVQLEGEGRQ